MIKYYKAFDSEFMGYGGYQFEIGKTYQTDNIDNWEWFHYAEHISSTLINFSNSKNIRVCIVTPLGEICKFKARNDGYEKGYYFTTNKIKILKELSYEQILSLLEEEKCSFEMIVQYMKPSADYLIKNKAKIKKSCIAHIIKRDDLSLDEKIEILPHSVHKHLEH